MMTSMGSAGSPGGYSRSLTLGTNQIRSTSDIALPIRLDMTPRPPILTLSFQSIISYSNVEIRTLRRLFLSSGQPIISVCLWRPKSFSDVIEGAFKSDLDFFKIGKQLACYFLAAMPVCL